MKTLLVACLIFTALVSAAEPSGEAVKLTKRDDRVRIEIGGKLFSE